MSDLLTSKDVAERLGIPEERVKRATKAEGWPCVRFGHRTIRYREEHVEAIIALYELASAKPRATKPGLPGQTHRSRQRSAS